MAGKPKSRHVEPPPARVPPQRLREPYVEAFVNPADYPTPHAAERAAYRLWQDECKAWVDDADTARAPVNIMAYYAMVCPVAELPWRSKQ